MFYHHKTAPNLPVAADLEAALVVLNVAEAKRLIARAVAALPEVKKAMQRGIVMISRGVTNAYVVEELLGEQIEAKGEYTMGCIAGGEITVNMRPVKTRPHIVVDGAIAAISFSEALKKLTPDDVFIKGANAIDPEGNAGVLVSSPVAGSIGEALPILIARGCHLIVPVGLEKMVPSVPAALPKCKMFRFKYATGLPASLVPLADAKVITEIQAMEILCGVSGTEVASGGIGGSEGASVLALEGSQDALLRAFDLVKSVKGERPVAGPPDVLPGAVRFDYDAQKTWANWRQQMAGQARA